MKAEIRHANIQETIEDLEAENDTQYVSLDEWKLGSKYILTRGAMTSIILAAHNRQTGQGLVGQFSTDTRETPFEEALRHIPDLGHTTGTGIVLAGVGISNSSHEENARITGERSHAQFMVVELVPNRGGTQIAWNDQANTAMDGFLNCHTGELTIELKEIKLDK